jgi:hypothetical protein
MMRFHVLGFVLVVASTVGCHTMRPVALDDLDTVRPGRVWVTRADQSVVVVSGPRVVRNRLAGFIDGTYQVIPADEVEQILVRRPEKGKTAALVAAGAVGLAATAYLLSGTGGSKNPCRLQSSECEERP